MWTMVLILGMGMAVDPVRLGLAVVMVSRRRPMVNLLAFWLGGIVAGIGVGIAVLVVMREVALAAMENATSAFSSVTSEFTIITGGRLYIALGLFALLVVAVISARARIATRLSEPVFTPATSPVPVGGNAATLVEERPTAEPPAEVEEPPSRNLFARLGACTHDMLNRDRAWPAFVVGLASSFPPYEGIILLSIIMASGAAVGTQFSALIVFVLIVLAVIEIPLVGYLAMPDKTLAVMLQIQTWLRTYRRQIVQTILTVTGVLLLVQGVLAL
ncbi:GAP family protein [Mycobacterium spongiae]|uniref:GAP family protein n=1 Tax=Mycobacterium spongiae TaxID=886343 RepID=A0A975PWM6_9MYCO|nr:GAP family protein [Mycobacterium spongiae]QUR67330.1 GAP family protein [Mycobacterium spongiae]